MKPIDSKNIFDVVKKGYAANQPKKNGRIDPIYSLFDRDTPLPKCQELAFFTDTSICTGCKACEVACKQWNQLESDPYHWSGDSYDNTGDLSANNWRHVKFIERFPEKNEVDRPAPATLDALLKEPKAGKWLFMSDQCKHCRTSHAMRLVLPARLFEMNSAVFITKPIFVWAAVCVLRRAPSEYRKSVRRPDTP